MSCYLTPTHALPVRLFHKLKASMAQITETFRGDVPLPDLMPPSGWVRASRAA